MRTPARTGTTIAAAATSLVLALTLGSGAATADPGGSDKGGGTPSKAQVDQARKNVTAKKRGVAAIRADLGAAQNALDSATIASAQANEAYNGAVWDLNLAKKAAVAADRKAKRTDAKMKNQRKQVARMVVRDFQGGDQIDQLSVVLDADSTDDVLDKYGVTYSARSSMDADYRSYRVMLTKAQVAKTKANAARAKAGKLKDVAAKARAVAVAAERDAGARVASMEARTAQLTRELGTAQGISARLATQRADAIRLAAARRAARNTQPATDPAPTTGNNGGGSNGGGSSSDGNGGSSGGSTGGSTGGSGGGSTDPNPPAPGGGVGAAISFAKAQLGDPYSWGATGPNSWDCSGLMLKAWAAGGKSLPRTSRQQYASGSHISRSQLQPGDLVFWGSSPGGIYHVAMYIGNNQIIHAPRTGRDVEIVSIDYWIPPTYFARY